MAAGPHSGRLDLMSAATPLTCGHDMDVPESMLNLVRRRSVARPDGPASPVQAARMFTPGATMSGFSISGERMFGPREENAATTGDGWTRSFVPRNSSVAAAVLLLLFFAESAYRLMSFPADSPTAVAGRRWQSATSSSPLAAVLVRIIPTPPASFTTCPFCTRGLIPLSHITILPATDRGSSVPSRHIELGVGFELVELLSPFEAPVRDSPEPSFTFVGNSLSIVLAPTVATHGETFVRLIGSGPPFPAEHDTNTPFSMAAKVPTERLSR
ncbi:tryptophan synthase alpha chain [Striga asiatica]|uniref:Tryptophan synthase alpha chain n=1 Tax=Striga asiatica TaxID=4170 RepID=A0A5A7PVP8_STRAF|nr:tryptophan synthase alpha chain [Striga asiatica]